MVVKTDGYSEFGAHMYILSAQIYISRKFEKNSKKTHSSKCATCSELLEYNTTLFVCGYLCVCVCVNISTRMGMLVYLKSYYIISHFLNCRKSKYVLL